MQKPHMGRQLQTASFAQVGCFWGRFWLRTWSTFDPSCRRQGRYLKIEAAKKPSEGGAEEKRPGSVHCVFIIIIIVIIIIIIILV